MRKKAVAASSEYGGSGGKTSARSTSGHGDVYSCAKGFERLVRTEWGFIAHDPLAGAKSVLVAEAVREIADETVVDRAAMVCPWRRNVKRN